MKDEWLDDVKTTILRETIYEYIHHERNRRILQDFFCDGITIDQLSKKYDLHQNTIKAIIDKNKWKAFKHLKPEVQS